MPHKKTGQMPYVLVGLFWNAILFGPWRAERQALPPGVALFFSIACKLHVPRKGAVVSSRIRQPTGPIFLFSRLINLSRVYFFLNIGVDWDVASLQNSSTRII
jgi:hypothetical protein